MTVATSPTAVGSNARTDAPASAVATGAFQGITTDPAQWAGLHGPNNDPEAVGYVIPDVPLGTKRPVRVVTIGGGASGITMAYHVKQYGENIDLVVYEKSPELGGTWLDNRYPGCACDVPSHSYQFGYHPHAGWTHYYSPAEEICRYMNDIVDTHGLRGVFKPSHEVKQARWDDAAKKWALRILGPDGEFGDTCDFLINGSGILNNWKWPAISGIETFQGHLVHTARWDASYDFRDTRVAVIGVGSSAVQTVPQLQPIVKKMSCFIRSGAWILAAGAAAAHAGPGGSNKEYTAEEMENQDEFLAYRRLIEDDVNARFRMYLKNTPQQQEAREFAKGTMAEKLDRKPELVELLTPKFAVGCRRLTPGNGFLESLCEDNVTVVSSAIESITPKGLRTADGQEHEVDAIVCATGFDVSLLPRFPFFGQGGADLRQRWTDGPVEAYMSLMVPDFPNYFMFLGPSAPVAHGSLTHTIERVSAYILKAISKCQAEGVRSIAPKAQITRQFNIHRNALMPTTAWSSTCSSWYKNGKQDGPVIAIHPGSKAHFIEMIREPRFEHFEIDYEGNPFSYLGNGLSLLELEEGNDLSWYLTDPTFEVPYSRLGRRLKLKAKPEKAAHESEEAKP